MSRDEPAEITLAMIRDALFTAVVCDALDALGYPNQALAVRLAPQTADSVLVGRAKTTLWVDMAHEDPRPYELELLAVDSCRPDDVLVAAAGGSLRSGIWGELLSTAARNRGCVGAIVDGGVRDVRAMQRMSFPVYARGVCPRDSLHRQRVIDIDVAIDIGGVRFRPGDLVIADVDGIAVVPREIEQPAIRRAWEKVHAENQVRDAIRAGMKATEAYETYGVL